MLGNPELDADIVNSAIDDMLTVLERAGVIVQDQLEFSQERYRQRRVGGTVALTPFGTLMQWNRLVAAGSSQTLDAASDLTAQRLAELAAAEMLEVEAWFSLVAQWVDEQADRVAGGARSLREPHRERGDLLRAGNGTPTRWPMISRQCCTIAWKLTPRMTCWRRLPTAG